MQRCRLSPHQNQRGFLQPSNAPAVKFCLAMGGESPDTSSSSLSSIAAPEEALPTTTLTAKRFLEPPRPVTMATCCRAERKASEGSQRQLWAQNQQKQQQQQLQNQSRVYCENSLAPFRPPLRRTFSFPPPPACSARAMPILIEPPEVPIDNSRDDSPAANNKDHNKDQSEALPISAPIKFTASASPSPDNSRPTSPIPSTIIHCGGAVARRRRRVRFADALGFELTSVRVVACDPEEPPVIPRHVLTALRRQISLRAAGSSLDDDQQFDVGSSEDDDEDLIRAGNNNKPSPPAPMGYSTCWKPLFKTQPSAAVVERRLADQKISLESIRLETMALEATVLVKNLGPVKQVWMRLTDNAWRHHVDLGLQFAEQLPDGTIDRFRLLTCLPIGAFSSQSLEFALGYRVEGSSEEFWDNNLGSNYSFRRLSQLHRASCACY